jgi:dTDP-4-dehydrorhamnose 3,5-epimerase
VKVSARRIGGFRVRIVETALPGVLIVEPDVHRDSRGYFLETFHQGKYADLGIPGPFVQDNHSFSRHGTLRGLHAQLARPQGKLVRVTEGEVYDVAVDIRAGSPTFGRWAAAVLSGDNFRQVFIPPGFAHGVCVLSEAAHLEYKCTDFYDPGGELTIAWDDPDLAIAWPVRRPHLSAKDAAGRRLAEVLDRLPRYGRLS